MHFLTSIDLNKIKKICTMYAYIRNKTFKFSKIDSFRCGIKQKYIQGTLPKGNTLKLLQVKVRIKSFMKAAKIITTCINN